MFERSADEPTNRGRAYAKYSNRPAMPNSAVARSRRSKEMNNTEVATRQIPRAAISAVQLRLVGALVVLLAGVLTADVPRSAPAMLMTFES